MATPTVGSVVLVRFPFSDLSDSKMRPAFILADVGMGDYLLCQITSKQYADLEAIEVTEGDFTEGSLHRTSYIRPGKIFTANQALIVREVGILNVSKWRLVVLAIESILNSPIP